MKIAVTYETDGSVFQHFGKSRQFKVYDVVEGTVAAGEVRSTEGQGHGALSVLLRQWGVTHLLCGGIGPGARDALAAAGIELYPGVEGDADSRVADFLAGNLAYNPEPQCGHGHHHNEHHGQGGEHGCGGHH